MRPVDWSILFSTAASGTSFTRTHIFISRATPWVLLRRSYSLGALTDESISFLRGRLTDVIHDRLRRGAGGEHLGHAEPLELRNVLGRDRAADRDEHVLDPLFAQQLDYAWHERHVGAGEDRQADRVGVLLDDGLHDLFGGL